MRSYRQLTTEQRYHMYGLKKAGYKQAAIALEIGVHKSTISREFRRNKGQRGWRPKQAQQMRDARRRGSAIGKQFARQDWNIVERLIRQDMSPEQVAARLKLEETLSISHETIYMHIYADKRAGGDLWEHLRCQKTRRKRYGSGQERRGSIRNRTSIDNRPAIVEAKTRIGDWEGDTIIGKDHKGVLVTLAERKSRFVLAGQLPGKQANGVAIKIGELLAAHLDKCITMTFDNGKEFAEHEQLAKNLNADIYFAHPYHSWERGLNENSNGLLRQYFPKNKALTEVTEDEVLKAVERLNHRPRKVLGYRTPHEVFFGVQKTYTKPSGSVALQD